jgi:hypothetical protein
MALVLARIRATMDRQATLPKAAPADPGRSTSAGGHAGSGRVLVLNATYEPINVCTVRRAVVLLLKEKAEVIEHASWELRAETVSMTRPMVIRLVAYVRVPRDTHRRKITRRAVFATRVPLISGTSSFPLPQVYVTDVDTGELGHGVIDVLLAVRANHRLVEVEEGVGLDDDGLSHGGGGGLGGGFGCCNIRFYLRVE